LLAFGPTPWRETLPYAEDESLIALDRLRFVDRVPTAIHCSVISAAVAQRIGLTVDIAARPYFSLYRLFDEAGLQAVRGVEKLRARSATSEESRLLRLRDGEHRVVMSVRRQTFADDGTILDVVDAVYDARRYAYEAEIRRDRGSASPGPLSLTSREKDNASSSDVRHDFGPRLGPWGSFDGDRG
jgi:GntR family transcriptional regulator